MGRDELLYGALADERRRLALQEVLEHGTLTLPDLAECVAEAETGTPVRELSPDRVSRIYFSLYHRHVPKLEEVGLVAYDQESDLVTTTDEVLPSLSAVQDVVNDMFDVVS